MDQLKQLTEFAPFISLWFGLNVLGWVIKKGDFIQTKRIPALMFILGGIIYPFVSDPHTVGFAVRNPEVAQVLTGLTIGGAAVGGHQLFRKLTDKIGLDFNDTSQLVKDAVKKEVDKVIDTAVDKGVDKGIEKAEDKKA